VDRDGTIDSRITARCYTACVAEFPSMGIKAARRARRWPGSPAAPLTAARPLTLRRMTPGSYAALSTGPSLGRHACMSGQEALRGLRPLTDPWDRPTPHEQGEPHKRKIRTATAVPMCHVRVRSRVRHWFTGLPLSRGCSAAFPAAGRARRSPGHIRWLRAGRSSRPHVLDLSESRHDLYERRARSRWCRLCCSGVDRGRCIYNRGLA
jgi:hypothetical protein